MTETTLLSITLRLAGDVTIFEISYMPLSASRCISHYPEP